jgi:hypothetical protein
MRPLRPAPVRRATLPPFTHLPAALARLATPKSVAVVAVEATESTEPAPVASAELTTTQVSVAAGVVLDLAGSAPPPSRIESVADTSVPDALWTTPAADSLPQKPAHDAAALVVPDGEPLAGAAAVEDPSWAESAADVAEKEVAAVPTAFEETSPAPAEVVTFVTPEQPLSEAVAPSPSLDSELSAFELRDEERVAPPEPIPGLSMEPELVGDESVAPGEPEGARQLEHDEEDGFSAEIAVVTSELRTIHMQEACAEVLEKVAARLRAGQIPAAVSDTRSEAAVLAAVLASLLAQRG